MGSGFSGGSGGVCSSGVLENSSKLFLTEGKDEKEAEKNEETKYDKDEDKGKGGARGERSRMKEEKGEEK